MTATKKLAEAQFFLEKMKAVTIVEDRFRFYLSACVSALYSCIQHLLFDYAKKYWPSLGPENHVDAWHFQLLAKATEHPEALKFIEWYNRLDGRIRTNRDASLVWKVRRLETHIKASPLEIGWDLVESTDITDTLEYGIMRPTGVIEPSGSRPPTMQRINAIKDSSAVVYFHGDDSVDHDMNRKQVPDVLHGATTFLGLLLAEARQNFGSTGREES